jgi:glutamyl-Q tRNA(Asp) synthetase
MRNTVTDYRGRFAPTPSGPLHFGSLFAAVVSFLDAKHHEGQWLVRIEDLDPPRTQAGATQSILNCLESHGLNWDESVRYQSNQSIQYEERLSQLESKGRLFWCNCSRKSLTGSDIYPGFCREYSAPRPDCAIRFTAKTDKDDFQDVFQGQQKASLIQDYGDVVLKRRDGLFAYQLAVVADDIDQHITHVIRGMDLLSSTYWQRELYREFDHSQPEFGHFAVLHAAGASQKLSKQNLAPPVIDGLAVQNLLNVFELLDLNVTTDTPARMLQEATHLWQRSNINEKQILHTDIFALD